MSDYYPTVWSYLWGKRNYIVWNVLGAAFSLWWGIYMADWLIFKLLQFGVVALYFILVGKWAHFYFTFIRPHQQIVLMLGIRTVSGDIPDEFGMAAMKSMSRIFR